MSADHAVRERVALVAALVAVVIALAWALWPDPAQPTATPPPPQTVLPGTTLRSAQCHHQAETPFVPTRITVPEVTRNAEVVALQRDGNNVPGAISLGSSNAKTAFAWDEPTIKPGSAHGNVLLNTHTWPDGTSMGNHLLDKLEVGGRIILHGDHGEELCYKVTEREVIVASDGSTKYYAQDGPPQIALIVCSPPRLGPGNWLHRTIWYASPLGSPQARAVA